MQANRFVRPALENLTRQVAHSFAEAAFFQPRLTRDHVYERFLRTYRGAKMRALRATARGLPFREAWEMELKFREVGQTVAAIRRGQDALRRRKREAAQARRHA